MIEFDYGIITKSEISVVTFKGKMDKEIKDKLVTCHQELLGQNAKMFILYFKDVSNVESTIFREMVLLQQDLRKKNSEVYVVGLNTTLKGYLCEKAIIRQSEVKNTLDEVFSKKVRKAV